MPSEFESPVYSAADAEQLSAFAKRALLAIGMPLRSATTTTDAMVWADLHGLPPHGVVRRLSQCVKRVLAGGTVPTAIPTLDRDHGALSIMDGHNAWGQVAGVAAMQAAIQKARVTGAAVIAVRNTGSAAAIGYYPTLAIRNRMIGITITNSPALISPPNGNLKVLGNQAHAFGFPSSKPYPILFDSSLTMMSTGEMDRRLESGEPLPEGVLLDQNGVPTTNPADWVQGFLSPVGFHRGYGLALAFEALTAILSGSSVLSAQVTHPFDHSTPQGVSMVCIAIAPELVMPYASFLEGIDRLIDAVHMSGARGGTGPAPRVPGERRYKIAEARAREGVPLTASELEAIEALAIELSIDPLEWRAITA